MNQADAGERAGQMRVAFVDQNAVLGLDQERLATDQELDRLDDAAGVGEIPRHEEIPVDDLAWMGRHAVSSKISGTCARRPRSTPDAPGNQGRILRGATNRAIDVFTDQVDRSIRDAELELYFRIPRPELRKGGNQNTACGGAPGIDPQKAPGPGLRPT